MNKQEILDTIKSLSKSQGFYCRVLQVIEEDKSILDKLANMNIKDPIDLILILEQ